MFSVKQSKDILGAYCFFWVVSMLVTVLALIVKEPTSFAIFKIVTAVAYGLHGAMGLEVFDQLRKSGGLDNPEWNLFGIGQGFHGIFGIFLFFWALGSFCFSEPLNSLAPSKKLSAESGFRSRVFFYLVTIELGFVSALVIATALSYSHVPLNYSGCRTSRLDGTALEDMSDWMHGSAKQICTRTVTIQITGIMTAILAFLQAMCYVHLAAYPRIVRYLMYLIFHQAPPRHGYAVIEQKPQSYDIEKLLGYGLLSESPKFHDMLADDTIAEKIASNLHFVDIANLSCTSGPVRQTMRGDKKKPSDKRLQLFCEATCEGGEKSECWACARMICKTCRYMRSQIYSPLTDSHAKNCFAVCTTCYILRAPALPAPKAALADSASLLNQHNDCWNRCSKREPMTEDVKLCKSCNLLGNLEVAEVREQRDAEALRRAHGGRLWCAECQKSLGKGRRRWFICETGGHECNWKGHQMC